MFHSSILICMATTTMPRLSVFDLLSGKDWKKGGRTKQKVFCFTWNTWEESWADTNTMFEQRRFIIGSYFCPARRHLSSALSDPRRYLCSSTACNVQPQQGTKRAACRTALMERGHPAVKFDDINDFFPSDAKSRWFKYLEVSKVHISSEWTFSTCPKHINCPLLRWYTIVNCVCRMEKRSRQPVWDVQSSNHIWLRCWSHLRQFDHFHLWSDSPVLILWQTCLDLMTNEALQYSLIWACMCSKTDLRDFKKFAGAIYQFPD